MKPRTFVVDILPAGCQIEFDPSGLCAFARNVDTNVTGTLIAVDPETRSLRWCDLDPDGAVSPAGFLISRSRTS